MATARGSAHSSPVKSQEGGSRPGSTSSPVHRQRSSSAQEQGREVVTSPKRKNSPAKSDSVSPQRGAASVSPDPRLVSDMPSIPGIEVPDGDSEVSVAKRKGRMPKQVNLLICDV